MLVASLIGVNLEGVLAYDEYRIVKGIGVGLPEDVGTAVAPDQPVEQFAHFVVVSAVGA